MVREALKCFFGLDIEEVVAFRKENIYNKDKAKSFLALGQEIIENRWEDLAWICNDGIFKLGCVLTELSVELRYYLKEGNEIKAENKYWNWVQWVFWAVKIVDF